VKARSYKKDSLVIVYDAEAIQHPDERLFDPEHWEARGGLEGKARGRGSALFLNADFAQAVLRRYLRGGQAARISRDRYLFTGYRRSRPVREFRLLATLHAAGLPVPAPLAALCRREGLFYTGWLMTRRIEGARTLADRLAEGAVDPAVWQRVGACIRRFHDRGAVHADLNAHNILIGPESTISLIDFDRGRISRGNRRAFKSNLKRLQRSLDKLWPTSERSRPEECWRLLRQGYARA
jgi:3-deoxy-D-manno-octulosonic acid kinase